MKIPYLLYLLAATWTLVAITYRNEPGACMSLSMLALAHWGAVAAEMFIPITEAKP